MNDFLRYLNGLFLLLIVSGVFMTLSCSETEAQKKMDHQSAPSYDYKGKLPALATSGGVYVLKLPENTKVDLYKGPYMRHVLAFSFKPVGFDKPQIGDMAKFKMKIDANTTAEVKLSSDRTFPTKSASNDHLSFMNLWLDYDVNKLMKEACPQQPLDTFCNIDPWMCKDMNPSWHRIFRPLWPSVKNISKYNSRWRKSGVYILPRLSTKSSMNIVDVVGLCQNNFFGLEKSVPSSKDSYKCTFMGFLAPKKNIGFSISFFTSNPQKSKTVLYQNVKEKLVAFEAMLNNLIKADFN